MNIKKDIIIETKGNSMSKKMKVVVDVVDETCKTIYDAAVCMMHPEVAQWVKGKLYHNKEGWGTHPDSTANRETIVSIDKDKFWTFMLDKC